MIQQLQALHGELRTRHPRVDFSRLDENLGAFMRGEKRTSPHPHQRPTYWYKGLRDKPWHDRERVILLVEFWHPDLNAAEIEFFQRLSPLPRENPGLL